MSIFRFFFLKIFESVEKGEKLRFFLAIFYHGEHETSGA